jgi:hypothetical protein
MIDFSCTCTFQFKSIYFIYLFKCLKIISINFDNKNIPSIISMIKGRKTATEGFRKKKHPKNCELI